MRGEGADHVFFGIFQKPFGKPYAPCRLVSINRKPSKTACFSEEDFSQCERITVAMKCFLILCLVALASATYYPPPPPKSSQQTTCNQRQDLDWVRQNAENLLYLEYMRKQASSDDEWQSQMESSDYQIRLNEMRSMNEGCVTPPIEMPICGESMSCGTTSCNSNCEFYGQQIATFQMELKRQKLMIQRLYSQVLIMSQSGSSCNRKFLTLSFFDCNNVYDPCTGFKCPTFMT